MDLYLVFVCFLLAGVCYYIQHSHHIRQDVIAMDAALDPCEGQVWQYGALLVNIIKVDYHRRLLVLHHDHTNGATIYWQFSFEDFQEWRIHNHAQRREDLDRSSDNVLCQLEEISYV